MTSNFIKKIFSVPDYISLSSSGIEIYNNSIKYIEFSNIDGAIQLSNFGEVLLKPNIFKDGEILNREELIKALHIVKGNLKKSFVKVSIPEEKTYLFNIKLPYVNQEEIRSVLEYKIEENVPLKLEESIFEFKHIIKPKNKNEELFLNVTVIPKSIIDIYTEIFNEVGLNIVSFETESMAISKTIIPRNDLGSYMIVNMKDTSTTLSIVSNGVTCLTSSLTIGGNSVVEGLKKVLPESFNKTNKIPDNILSFDDYDEEVYVSLLNIFSIIKDEIEKFNKYWVSQIENYGNNGFKEIEKIIFCGKASAVPGFVNHINKNTGIDSVLGNVWVNVFRLDNFIPDIKFFDSLDYAVVIGLGIPSKNSM